MRTMQRGLSLVELLVALAIGSFLMLTSAQVVIDNKLSYLFQRAQADNQNNARFTMQWLDRQLARTGFKRRPEQTMAAAFPALDEAGSGVPGCVFAAGQVVVSVNAKTLCIRYQPSDRQELDCLGNSRPANTASLAIPYAEPVEAYVEKLSINATQQLMCTSKDGTATLIEGITDARFDFGVAAPGALDVLAYTATPASNDLVRSIRYAALMSAAVPGGTAASNALAWRYWYEKDFPAAPTLRLYQVVKGTATLRNVLP